jgi:hypothetical protein
MEVGAQLDLKLGEPVFEVRQFNHSFVRCVPMITGLYNFSVQAVPMPESHRALALAVGARYARQFADLVEPSEGDAERETGTADPRLNSKQDVYRRKIEGCLK